MQCPIFLQSAHGELKEAAVLFADASGFTELTQRIMQDADDSEGAETLCVILNRFYNRLLAIVDFFGGDVIKVNKLSHAFECVFLSFRVLYLLCAMLIIINYLTCFFLLVS